MSNLGKTAVIKKSLKSDNQRQENRQAAKSKVLETSTKVPAKQLHPQAQQIKVVLVGDGNSGKTSFLISFTTDAFSQDYVPTIFDITQVIIKRGGFHKLLLFDTAGQPCYRKLRSIAYPKTNVFLICFSLTNLQSFKNSINQWINQIQDTTNQNDREVIFVGMKQDQVDQVNKKDMTDQKGIFWDQIMMRKKIRQKGYKLMVCSALTQKGLGEVFDEIIDRTVQRRKPKNIPIKQAQTQCQLI